MNSKKVLTIIVTYNRVNLLKRCILAVQNQSYKNNELLVINNSSTDNTADYLSEQNINFVTQPNSGSAGGWNRGMEEGWKGNYDLIWMMDDDGFPDENALQNLVPYLNDTNNNIAVSSLVVKEDKREEFVFPLPKLNSAGFPILFSLKRKYNLVSELGNMITYPYIHPFNGALIDLKKSKEIGNIDTSYFMYGDETDYFYRLKKKGIVFTVLKALHYHPDVSRRKVEEKKVFYFIRNTIIVNHLYFDKSFLRDFFTVAVVLYRINKQDGLLSVLSYLVGTNRKYFYPAIKDGHDSKRNNLY